MPTFTPLESLGFHCNLTFKAFSVALEKRLADTGVSRVQFIALANLIALGAMPQKDLAELLSITSASTVRLVDRLCRDGWAEREADAADRRIKRIAPTQKAVDAWEEMSFHAKSITTQAYAGLTPEEIETVKIVLRKVRDNLQT